VRLGIFARENAGAPTFLAYQLLVIVYV